MQSTAYSSSSGSYLAGIRQQHSATSASSNSFSTTNGYGNGNSMNGTGWNGLMTNAFSFNDVLRGGKVPTKINEILGRVCPNVVTHHNHPHYSTPGTTEEKFSRKVFVGGLPPDIDEVNDYQQQLHQSTACIASNDLYNAANIVGSVVQQENIETVFTTAPETPRPIVKCGYASSGSSLNVSPMKSPSVSSLSLSLSSLSIGGGSKQNSPARPVYPSNVTNANSSGSLSSNYSSVFMFQPQQSSTPVSRCFPPILYPAGEFYSRKVFVGGLPIDISEDEINATFSKFGACFVDWPHKAESKSYFPPKGYAFLIFETEASVQSLIKACVHDGEKYFLHVSSPTIKGKAVQLRPWMLTDSDYYVDQTLQLDPRKTIFVGGVPRPLKAVDLARIMDQLYGGVCYAGIDTDPELKYPKGAGRVAFSNQQSYINAIAGRFVQLHVADIPDKRAEVKPYVLDDQICDECNGRECSGKYAPFFCANVSCLSYYCETCWAKIHSRAGRENHKPLVKEGSDRPRVVPFKWV